MLSERCGLGVSCAVCCLTFYADLHLDAVVEVWLRADVLHLEVERLGGREHAAQHLHSEEVSQLAVVAVVRLAALVHVGELELPALGARQLADALELAHQAGELVRRALVGRQLYLPHQLHLDARVLHAHRARLQADGAAAADEVGGGVEVLVLRVAVLILHHHLRQQVTVLQVDVDVHGVGVGEVGKELGRHGGQAKEKRR